MISPTLARVEAARSCTGCGACAALAPEKFALSLSDDGFHRPRQTAPLDDNEEAAFAAVCPGRGMSQPRAEGEDDPFWGPVVGLWKGAATDPELRRNASSGGALSALLMHLLHTGQVAHVVQTGAGDIPYGNGTVVSRDAASVFEAAGSRYAPSSPVAGIDSHLAKGEPFAFVGKPCDVAALRAMARRDPRIDRLVPYMISFFCAGVPSLKGAEAVLQRMGCRPEDVASFRYRGEGWPGPARAVLKDGSVRTLTYEQSWGDILSKHLQFRCKICPDGTGGAADVVCADAWECDDEGYPLFEEREGVSLVLARTTRGAALVAAAQAADAIEMSTARVADIAAMQPGQLKKKRLALSRLLALRLMLRPVPAFHGYRLGAAARSAGLIANLRSFLGTCRRIAGGRA
ncbi:MAG: Coenzyme F420 hydrogenase/dehydrogenase, beta subunit C-terminal domain [Parvularculaceae bacterium]|nr:Coenzyme F420 hydrogenase/dehydrogenase, beta subunit C-terminal domain [Parvularculaceae bacterium]